MLSCCGHALSQGDGSDFHPGYNWEATPPGYSTRWELGDGWLHTTGPWLPRLTMTAQKSWKNMGVLAGVADCEKSWKWGCRGRLAPGFKPRHSSHAGWNQEALGAPFATWLRKQEWPCKGRKGVKGLLLVSHEKVPHGFGLRTGDQDGDTANGAGNHGRPASGTWITGKNLGLPEPCTFVSFPEIWYSRLGKEWKERLCVFVSALRKFGILSKIFYSKSI